MSTSDLVPTSWLDPLLTGPDAVLGRPPWGYTDVERLLAAIKKRIEATEKPKGKPDGVVVIQVTLTDGS